MTAATTAATVPLYRTISYSQSNPFVAVVQMSVTQTYRSAKYHSVCLSVSLSAKITRCYFCYRLLPLDEAIASRAAFVIVSGSDGRADGQA